MKENLLLDAFALEIQMCTDTKNSKRMKSVYPQTTKLNSVILDPRVMGVIKECGGKMFMAEKKWENALDELFDSFKNY
jgi:COP9 signalosome complex subunit 2